ncbi:MAG: alpha/beta hydrolase [Bacteroidia bacterium]
MHQKQVVYAGKKSNEAQHALILLHGRGGSAEDMIGLATQFSVADFTLAAPKAAHNTWYPFSFMAPPDQNEPWLSSALYVVNEVVNDLNKQGFANEEIYFAGFSQGACLMLEFVTRNAKRWGGVAAFTGGLIGDKIYNENYKGDFENTPVFIGTSDPDPHVPLTRVQETVSILKSMHADVSLKIYPNMAHTISLDEIEQANKLIFKSEKSYVPSNKNL